MLKTVARIASAGEQHNTFKISVAGYPLLIPLSVPGALAYISLTSQWGRTPHGPISSSGNSGLEVLNNFLKIIQLISDSYDENSGCLAAEPSFLPTKVVT